MTETTLLGSGTLALNVATYTTSSLAAGAHAITSAYAGDSNFSALTSAALPKRSRQSVTTTTLVAAPNPAIVGQAVVFTATVAPPPIATPAGTVSFYNGATLLGMGTVNSSGIATFSTSGLPTGGLSITAVYSGNAGSAGSTSTAFTETVTPAALTTVIHRHGIAQSVVRRAIRRHSPQPSVPLQHLPASSVSTAEPRCSVQALSTAPEWLHLPPAACCSVPTASRRRIPAMRVSPLPPLWRSPKR